MADANYCLFARKLTKKDELQTPSGKKVLILIPRYHAEGTKQNGRTIEAPSVDISDCAKHTLLTGKREDKQAILACVTTTLYLKAKTIRTRKSKTARF